MRTSTRRGAALAIGGLLALTSLASVSAAEQHHRRHHQHRAYVAPAPAPAPLIAYDNVGSIITDAHGNSVNRITGERYFKCMEDEGYGRVRPCDAGDNH